MKHLAILLLLMFGLAAPVAAGETGDDISAVLAAQAEAWNAGDIPGFMDGYWRSDEMRFASGGAVTYGWAETLDSYQRRYDTPDKMGELSFSDLDIKVLSKNYALAFGRWDLKLTGLDSGGLFTLLFEKMPGGWRIVADHTSADDAPVAVVSE